MFNDMKEELICARLVKVRLDHTPGLLQPLVEGVGMLRKLLAQLVVFLLPSLLLLQLQLSLLHSHLQKQTDSSEVNGTENSFTSAKINKY